MINWIKKYDIFYRALSILLAILIWFYVIERINPNIEVTFNNIPINYSGRDTIFDDYGYSIIDGYQDTINVTLTGKRSDMLSIRREDITAIADISKIDTSGNHTILCRIKVTNNGITVNDADKLTVTLFIDRFIETDIPISLVIEGTSAQGYMISDERTVNPATVKVKGPASEINNISYARVLYSEENIKTSVNKEMPVSLIDLKGKEYEPTYSKILTDSVNMSIPVLLKKELKLRINTQEGGGLNTDNVEIHISPSAILAAGDETALANLNELLIGSIKLENITENTEMTFPVKLPEGLKNLSEVSEAKVSINLKDVTTRTFMVTKMSIINAPANKICRISSGGVEVKLRGSATYLNSLKAADISLVANMSGLGAYNGRWSAPATVVIDKANPGVGVVGSYKVSVLVSSK